MHNSGEVCRNHPSEGTGRIWDSGANAGIRTGVSTSRKCLFAKKCRTARMIRARNRRTSARTASFQESSVFIL